MSEINFDFRTGGMNPAPTSKGVLCERIVILILIEVFMKLSLISKYRTHIMGAAMMWIMWFHSAYAGKSEVFHFIHNIGFFGVDMFLMVSGLGLYFSMRKSKSMGEFYKKRAVRILPAYLIVTV